MKIIKKEHKLCVSCMEEHEIDIIKVDEVALFKNVEVRYSAFYQYCCNCDEIYASEK